MNNQPDLAGQPASLSAKWNEPGPGSPPNRIIDSTTVFKRLSDGIELNGFELAVAYLKDPRVGKSIMEQYFSEGKARELREQADKDSFTASGNIDLTFSW